MLSKKRYFERFDIELDNQIRDSYKRQRREINDEGGEDEIQEGYY